MAHWRKQRLQHFQLNIYANQQRATLLASYSGKGLAWHNYLSLTIPTEFDCAHADLDAIWQQLLSQRETQFCGQVTFLESIVKWNDTMLMRWPYYLEIQLGYP